MNTNDGLTPDEQRLAAQVKAAYEPYRASDRPLRGRRPLRLWLASFAAVVALIVVGTIALRPPSTLATWTREPTPSEVNALADASEGTCREEAAQWQRRGAQARWPDDPAMGAMSALPLVAHDQRGEASATLFADADSRSAAICTIIPVAGQPPYVELAASTDLIPEDFGSISVWMATAGTNWDYGSRWEIAGRVVAPADDVVIVRSDGERVTATLRDGWFLAWWPDSSHPAQLLISSGDEVEAVDLGDRYDSGGPPCRVMVLDEVCIWSY